MIHFSLEYRFKVPSICLLSRTFSKMNFNKFLIIISCYLACVFALANQNDGGDDDSKTKRQLHGYGLQLLLVVNLQQYLQLTLKSL